MIREILELRAFGSFYFGAKCGHGRFVAREMVTDDVLFSSAHGVKRIDFRPNAHCSRKKIFGCGGDQA
ncbi:MAG TPA: hypothetical protein DEA22_04965 [Blastocatellia bacterium]|nr:hypothetical protein [Blastocatellia bacterium]